MKQKYLIHCQVGLLFLHVFPKAYMHIMTNKQFGGNELGESKHSQMLMYFRKKIRKITKCCMFLQLANKKRNSSFVRFLLKVFLPYKQKNIFVKDNT